MAECEHPTLVAAPGNNAGAKCLGCGRVWKRRALYVGNVRISWMGAEPGSITDLVLEVERRQKALARRNGAGEGR